MSGLNKIERLREKLLKVVFPNFYFRQAAPNSLLDVLIQIRFVKQ